MSSRLMEILQGKMRLLSVIPYFYLLAPGNIVMFS